MPKKNQMKHLQSLPWERLDGYKNWEMDEDTMYQCECMKKFFGLLVDRGIVLDYNTICCELNNYFS